MRLDIFLLNEDRDGDCVRSILAGNMGAGVVEVGTAAADVAAVVQKTLMRVIV